MSNLRVRLKRNEMYSSVNIHLGSRGCESARPSTLYTLKVFSSRVNAFVVLLGNHIECQHLCLYIYVHTFLLV